ncbi:MAG: 50S ribosomal protein L29 [Candidatus Spechtbacteria bacterium]|nr:50S ribosomal protein L29 [Candidatus Spechtbacteria bacterium]
MKIRELRQKPEDMLKKLLSEKQNYVLNLKFDVSGGRVKNVKELRDARKDIARISTLLSK